MVIALNVISYAQTPSYQWAKHIYGLKSEAVKGLATDGSGNIYVVGYFNSITATFDTTVLTNTTSTGSFDGFLTKFNSDGSVIWAKKIEGQADESINAVDIDGSGNIYVLGTFDSPSLTLGSFSLVNSATRSSFLAKYDTNGNVVWAKKIVSSGSDEASVIEVNPSGIISLAGTFYGSSITIGANIFINTNANTIEGYIAQYDNNGNLSWAKQIAGIAGEAVTSIKIDAQGNTYLGCNFSSPSISLAGTVLNNTNAIDNSDFAVAKLDNLGSVVWAKKFGGANDDRISAINFDGNGNLLITGNFISSNLNIQSTILNAATGSLYLIRLNTVGNVIQVLNTGGSYNIFPTAIDLDLDGNIFISGCFGDALNFNGVSVPANLDTFALFLTKFNSAWVCQWIKKAGILNFRNGAGFVNMQFNNAGDLFYTDMFQGTSIVLDSYTFANADSIYLNSFLTKINHSSLENSDFEIETTHIYPNPTLDKIFLKGFQYSENSHYFIYDFSGKVIKENDFFRDNEINVSNLNNGIYLLVLDGKPFKFIKQ